MQEKRGCGVAGGAREEGVTQTRTIWFRNLSLGPNTVGRRPAKAYSARRRPTNRVAGSPILFWCDSRNSI